MLNIETRMKNEQEGEKYMASISDSQLLTIHHHQHHHHHQRPLAFAFLEVLNQWNGNQNQKIGRNTLIPQCIHMHIYIHMHACLDVSVYVCVSIVDTLNKVKGNKNTECAGKIKRSKNICLPTHCNFKDKSLCYFFLDL